MPAYGYEFYLLVVNSISHEWAALTREISSWPLEDKIHIHARACNILYFFFKRLANAFRFLSFVIYTDEFSLFLTRSQVLIFLLWTTR